MKNLLIAMLIFALPMLAIAQEDDEPDYNMVQLVKMHVKQGANEAFEAAVKEHNEKYHEGAYSARLYVIATGEEAGTYVWRMGPCTMTDLDSRPDSDAHDEDWENNVSPHVAGTGSVEYWTRDEDLSYLGEDGDVTMVNIWWLDIADGEYDEFREFMEGVKTVYGNMEKKGIYVWWNRFTEDNGRDVAISWPMEGWSDFDNRDWNMKEEYDKEFGEGEWDNALDDWEDAVASASRVMWRIVN